MNFTQEDIKSLCDILTQLNQKIYEKNEEKTLQAIKLMIQSEMQKGFLNYITQLNQRMSKPLRK